MRKMGFYLLFFVFPSVLLGNRISDYYGSFKVLGYYPDYASWQFPVSSIPYDRLSHAIFFSIYPNADGSLNFSEVNLNHLSSLVSLAHAGNAKVLICAGGWNLSQGFSPMAANASARARFIQNIKNFCLNYGLDGVDLDWEPVSLASDRANYTILIQELKTVLAAQNLTLSVAVFAQGQEFLSSAIGSIDWIHVMAYDLGYPHSTYEAALAALNHWQAYGFGRSKIVLGVPFYGRRQFTGYFSYREIMAAYQPSPEIDLVDEISFNGIGTIEKKTSYLINNGYAGIMFWEMTQDTADNNSLLTAIARAFHFNSDPDFNCDRRLDFLDLNHLAEFWLMDGCEVDNAWCGRGDLDVSSRVSLTDLAAFCLTWQMED